MIKATLLARREMSCRVPTSPQGEAAEARGEAPSNSGDDAAIQAGSALAGTPRLQQGVPEEPVSAPLRDAAQGATLDAKPKKEARGSLAAAVMTVTRLQTMARSPHLRFKSNERAVSPKTWTEDMLRRQRMEAEGHPAAVMQKAKRSHVAPDLPVINQTPQVAPWLVDELDELRSQLSARSPRVLRSSGQDLLPSQPTAAEPVRWSPEGMQSGAECVERGRRSSQGSPDLLRRSSQSSGSEHASPRGQRKNKSVELPVISPIGRSSPEVRRPSLSDFTSVDLETRCIQGENLRSARVQAMMRNT